MSRVSDSNLTFGESKITGRWHLVLLVNIHGLKSRESSSSICFFFNTRALQSRTLNSQQSKLGFIIIIIIIMNRFSWSAKRFHLAEQAYSDNSCMTSKRAMYKEVRHERRRVSSLMLLTRLFSFLITSFVHLYFYRTFDFSKQGYLFHFTNATFCISPNRKERPGATIPVTAAPIAPANRSGRSLSCILIIL